jgi:hypothetical protein
MQGWLDLPEPGKIVSWPRSVAALLLISVLCLCAAGAADAAPPPGGAAFGSPPSGEIPILYNDHTVYAKPDILKRSRVLAALVKNGHVYIPLRSMFEQMGASVSVSDDGKTITATKDGAGVSVTLGKAEVVVNGETRPLDVPPMVYQGVVLVPVRVISEALGAYVLWVHDRRLVVVRYNPVVPPPPTEQPVPLPVPTAAPTIAPLAPTPAPTPTPEPMTYNGFIQAGFAAPHNYNEFSAGEYCPESYVLSAGYAFKHSPFAVKFDYRQDVYVTSDNRTDGIGNHYTQFATIDGGVAFTPVFLARQSTLDARLEYQIAAPRIYVGIGYLHTANNYGYPQLNGPGVGIEKLPDLRPGVNFYGSAFYYPTASGNYTVTDPSSVNAGKTYQQQYQILKYDVGLALVFAHFPLYLHGGISGDRYGAKRNAPIGQTHDGPYLGLGVKL